MKWKLVEYPKAGPSPPTTIEELNEFKEKHRLKMAERREIEGSPKQS